MESWSNIPEHIVEIFIEKVDNYRDFVTSSAVCKLWRSVVTKNLHRLPYKLPLALCYPCPHRIPLLFQPSGTSAKPNYFYSLTKKVFYCHCIPEIENKWIVGSSLGWLVTTEANGRSMYLLNPLTHVQIPLPRLDAFPSEHLDVFEGWEPYRFISKVIITSDPVSSKDDCLVIAIAGTRSRLYYCRIGDKSWIRTQGVSLINLRDVIISGSLIYIIHRTGLLLCLEIGDSVKGSLVNIFAEGIYNLHISLVDSSDGLLLVKCITTRDGNATKTTGFQVFRMVKTEYHSLSDSDTRRSDIVRYAWEPLNSIGDMAIFLGYGYSKCLKASTHTGIKANCIYFADYTVGDIWKEPYNKSKHMHDIGIYHLEGVVENITALANDDDSPPHPAIWFEPKI